MANPELAILLKAQDNMSKVLDSVEKKAGGLGKTLGDVGKIAGGFLAANVIAGGVQKLTGFVGDSIAAIKESALVNAQLDAVLKSTGGAAGLTADAIKNMAGSLEKASLFEDEAILQGQNLLLTFTNIGKDTFPRATQSMIDLAQAMGTDAKGSAIQLGKALNDPTQGISALTRVGVSFTEEQKEQIKVMQEAGNMAGAQAMILSELEKEFGGSAKAASDAAGKAEVYKDKMNDLKETIGAKLLPVSEKLMMVKLALINLIATKAIPALEQMGKTVASVVVPALAAVRDIILPLANLFGAALTGNLSKAHDEFIKLPKPLWGIAQALFDLGSFIRNDVVPAVKAVAEAIGDKLLPPLKSVIDFLVDHKTEAAVFFGAFALAVPVVYALAAAHAAQATAAEAAAVAEGAALLPVIAVTVGIAALVLGLVLLEKKTGFFSEQVWPLLKAALEETAKVVLPLLKAALITLQQGVDDLRNAWATLKPPLTEVAVFIAAQLVPVFETIGKFLKEHPILIGALVGAILLLVAPWLAVVAALIVVLAKWDDIKVMFTATIPQAIDSVITKIKELPVIGEIFQAAWEAARIIVETAFKLIKNYVETGINAVRDIITIVTALIHGDWDKAWKGVKQLFLDIFNGVIEDIKIKLGAVVEMFTKVGPHIVAALGDLLGLLSSPFVAAFDAIKGAALDMATFVLEKIRDLFQGMKDIADAFPGPNPFGNAMQSAIDKMNGTIDSMKVAAAGNAASLGSAVGEGLAQGVRSKEAAVAEAATGLRWAIEGSLRGGLEISSPSKLAIRLMQQFGDGMIIGLQSKQSALLQAIAIINRALMTTADDTVRAALRLRYDALLKDLQETTAQMLVSAKALGSKIMPEILDGIDNDLDGMIDEGFAKMSAAGAGIVDGLYKGLESRQADLLKAIQRVKGLLFSVADDATRAALRLQYDAMLKDLQDVTAKMLVGGAGIGGAPAPGGGAGVIPPGGGNGIPGLPKNGTNPLEVLSYPEVQALSQLTAIPIAQFGSASMERLALLLNQKGSESVLAFLKAFESDHASLFSTENLLNDLRRFGLSFAQGGIVPGPIGAPQLAVVHGGETITPARGGGGSISININAIDARSFRQWLQTGGADVIADEVGRKLGRRIV